LGFEAAAGWEVEVLFGCGGWWGRFEEGRFAGFAD
jgi:hypothetical protein